MVLPAVTSYDKLLPLVGGLAVAILAAAGVHASTFVHAIVGLALVLAPAWVYYKQNKGLNYSTASKLLVSLPAAVAGVFILFNIDVASQLDQIGQSALALLPFITAGVGNSSSTVELP